MLKINRIFIFLSLLLSFCLHLQANIFEKNLDFKEGIITYTITGSENGRKIIYIKDYGKKRVIYTNTKANLIRGKRKNEKIRYITPKWIYETGIESQTIKKFPNINYLLQLKYEKLNENEKKILKRNLKNRNRKVSENILGYACISTMDNGITSCRSTDMDLILKSEIHILGFHSKTLLNNIEKQSINDKIFKLPDLDIIEDKSVSKRLEQKASKIINSLLNQTNSTPPIKGRSVKKDDYQEIIQESIKKLEDL